LETLNKQAVNPYKNLISKPHDRVNQHDEHVEEIGRKRGEGGS